MPIPSQFAFSHSGDKVFIRPEGSERVSGCLCEHLFTMISGLDTHRHINSALVFFKYSAALYWILRDENDNHIYRGIFYFCALSVTLKFSDESPKIYCIVFSDHASLTLPR